MSFMEYVFVKKYALSVAVVAILTGCGNANVDAAKQMIEAQLSDPLSVQYRYIEKFDEDVVCGEFNAKNGMGGYVGFKKFVFAGTVHFELEPDDNSQRFWCTDNVGKKLAWIDVNLKIAITQIEELDAKIGALEKAVGPNGRVCRHTAELSEEQKINCLFVSADVELLEKKLAERAEVNRNLERMKADRIALGV